MKPTFKADGWATAADRALFGGGRPDLDDRATTGRRTVGLLAQEQLVNDNCGIVHGGALMTFADMALGLRCTADAFDGGPTFVTVQLQYPVRRRRQDRQLITCEPGSWCARPRSWSSCAG